MGRVISWALGGLVLLLLVIAAAGAGAMSALFGGGAAYACTATVTTPGAAPAGLTAEQTGNAAVIIGTGQRKGIPPRGWVIAVATSLQESRLINLGNLGAANDHDSLGLFQQRPSQGWGTPAEIMNPEHAATSFYEHLRAVPRWQTLPLTDAAQAVQRSAYPDAYADDEAQAAAIVAAVGSGSSWAIPEDLEHCLSICPAILSNAPVDVHTASGDVDLACSDTALGSAEPAPRNPDGSWPEEGCTIRPDPTTGNGCVTPRLLHLVQQADAAGLPKPGCYRVDDHGEHPKGRACDWMVTSGGEASGAQKARGDAMAAWAVANADRLGIRYVIWFRMIWTQDEGWHAYNNPWGGDDPSGWHTNHVHVSVH